MLGELITYLERTQDEDEFIAVSFMLALIVGVAIGIICATPTSWIVKGFIITMLVTMSTHIFNDVLLVRHSTQEEQPVASHGGSGARTVDVIKVGEVPPVDISLEDQEQDQESDTKSIQSDATELIEHVV